MMTRNKKKRTTREDSPSSSKKSNEKYSSTILGNNAVELGEMVAMCHGGTSGGLDVDCQRMDYLQVVWLLREKLNDLVDDLVDDGKEELPDPGLQSLLDMEMVRMDHGRISRSLDVECQRMDYFQVAWQLLKKLNDLVDGDKGEFPESGLQSILDMAASRNIVSVDPKMLNPVLWRTLSRELLLHIFARLPLPGITRLRSLSLEWRSELATANSDINQACDEASSTMVALLSRSSTNAFFVTIYDITNSRWQHAYHLRLRRLDPWNYNNFEPCHHTWGPVNACDGGLMCFISLWKPNGLDRLSIAVVNLLTRVHHELPFNEYSNLPSMVHIKVDSRTKCYKVVVVFYRARSRARTITIETYNSVTREWTRAMPPSGFILGPFHHWISMNGWMYKFPSSRPSAYDFGQGKLEFYNDFNPSVKDWVMIARALEKDRVFDLLEQTRMDTSLGIHFSFRIVEYHLDNQTKAWVKGKSYKCPGLEDPEVMKHSSVRLYACDGFLMVIFQCEQRSTCFKLLDLSTGEWSNVPENPNFEGLHTTETELCRVFWNAIP